MVMKPKKHVNNETTEQHTGSLLLRKNLVSLVVTVAVIAIIGWISSQWFFRVDLTTDKRYTLHAKTKHILKKAVKLGHISITGKYSDVYIPNETTHKIVNQANYNKEKYFKEFAELPAGKEVSNDIKNTGVFIDAMSLGNYYFLLFPGFDYVIPDGLLILREDNKYKLIFLEIYTNFL